METGPRVIVLGGPNGAGKTTAATELLPDSLRFLNADELAKTLPGYPSREVDFLAARMIATSMDDVEMTGADFAVESTLAGRTLKGSPGLDDQATLFTLCNYGRRARSFPFSALRSVFVSEATPFRSRR